MRVRPGIAGPLGVIAALTLGLLLMFIAPRFADARAGDLDPAYGRGGVKSFSVQEPGLPHRDAYTYPRPLGFDGPAAIVGATNLYFAGSTPESSHLVARRFVAVRINRHGKRDTEYGNGGTASIQFGATRARSVDDMVLDGNGRVLVAADDGPGSFSIERIAQDGTLDQTFAGDGNAEMALSSGANLSSVRLAVQSDGGIVVAAVSPDSTSGLSTLQLSRLNDDGSLDAGFSGGTVDSIANGLSHGVGSIKIDSQGRILLGEVYASSPSSAPDAYVRRFLETGATDPQFGNNGLAQLPAAFQGVDAGRFALALDPGDDVDALAFGLRRGSVLARLAASDGQPDISFGDAGVVGNDGQGGGSDLSLTDIDIQSNGRIVGPIDAGGGFPHLGSARLLATGAPDRAFGSRGMALTYPSRGSNLGAVLAPRDRMLAAGSGGGTTITTAVYRLGSGKPNDLDADGTRNGADRCRARFSDNASGCPTFVRKIELYHGKSGLVTGRVESRSRFCAQSRTVTVYGRRNGKRASAGRAVVLSNLGAYRFAANLDPRVKPPYVATLPRIFKPSIGICPSARSSPVDH